MEGLIGCAVHVAAVGILLPLLLDVLIAVEFIRTRNVSYIAGDVKLGARIWIGMRDWIVY